MKNHHKLLKHLTKTDGFNKHLQLILAVFCTVSLQRDRNGLNRRVTSPDKNTSTGLRSLPLLRWMQMFSYQHNCINPKTRHMQMQLLNNSTLYSSAVVLHPNLVFNRMSREVVRCKVMRCWHRLAIFWSGLLISGLGLSWPFTVSCLLLTCYWLSLHSTVCSGESIQCRQRLIDKGRPDYHLDSLFACVALCLGLFVNHFIYHIILTLACACVLMHVHLSEFLCESLRRWVCVHWQLLCSMRVFVFYPVGEAQLQCSAVPGAMLALIKHPHQSIGLIRCVCFLDGRNERKQKEVWKRGNVVFFKKSGSEWKRR